MTRRYRFPLGLICSTDSRPCLPGRRSTAQICCGSAVRPAGRLMARLLDQRLAWQGYAAGEIHHMRAVSLGQ